MALVKVQKLTWPQAALLDTMGQTVSKSIDISQSLPNLVIITKVSGVERST